MALWGIWMKKKGKKKQKKFIVIEISAVIAIIVMLLVTLLPNLKRYSIDSKKIGIRDAARNFIMAIEVARIKDKIEFVDTDSIKTIEGDKEKDDMLNKYISNLRNLEKIKELTIKEAKEILDNGADFEVNKYGEFIKVVK